MFIICYIIKNNFNNNPKKIFSQNVPQTFLIKNEKVPVK